jgi:ribokinase
MIIVFGSANVDLVMTLPSLPAPGETVLTESYRTVPGGKGANQALAAHRAGAETIFAGAVGDDTYAQLALLLLQSEGVDLSIMKISDRPTGCAAVLVDGRGENAIGVASGANLDARADQISDELLRKAQLVVLQREVPIEQSAELATRAGAQGIKVIFNLAPAARVPDGFLADVDYLIVNQVEAAFLAGSVDPEDVGTLAHTLAQDHDLTAVITLGANGVHAVSPEGVHTIPAPRVEVVDTTGAGDTFTGYLATGLATGAPLDQCLTQAVAAASLACTRPGAQPAIPTATQVTESSIAG